MRKVNISKKQYPDEVKMEAVKSVIDAGNSFADVAARLGMTTHSLYAWIRKFGPDSRGAHSQVWRSGRDRRLNLQRCT